MKKVKYDIQGMTCSSCSSHVEKAVNKLDGIKSANVNLLSNNMIVEYDEKVLDDEKIIKAVIDAGYGINLSEKISKDKSIKSEKKDENDELKSMKNRLIMSIIFLIPLMYVAMHQMLNECFELPIPNLIKTYLDGFENAAIFGFIQFLLLLPIVYMNRNYFIVGFKRLIKKSPNMDSLIAIGSGASIVYGIFAILMISFGLGHNQIDLVEKYASNIYFESAGTILTLITVGKYLEAKSKRKTSDAINKLMNLAPKTATVVRNDEEIEVALEEIMIDDIIIVKPGGSIRS